MKTLSYIVLFCVLFLSTEILVGQNNTTTNFTANKRYVVERTFIDPTATNAPTRNICDIVYLDGFDRTLQEIQVFATPDGLSDIVTPHAYGIHGRVEKTYLPYVHTGRGAWHNTPFSGDNWSIYGYGEGNYAFSKTEFENSPIDRVTAETGPGASWHQQQKKTTIAYGTNSNTEVKNWKVSANGSLSLGGYYAEKTLQKTITTDEDGNTSEVFVDRAGRTLLTVSINGEFRHETYSIYDDRGLLRYILPPELNSRLGSTQLPTTTQLNDYAFSYTYDKRGQNTIKKLPGCAPIYYVYDAKDRIVLSQDGNQRTTGKWDYCLYDQKNRVTESGEVVLTGNPSHTNLLNQISILNDYTPQGTLTPLSYNQYDTYTVTNITPLEPVHCSGFDTPQYQLTTDLLTCTKTRILGENTWLTTTHYYDDRCREIQRACQNIQGGVSRYYFAYDFTGNFIRKREVHGKSSGASDITETTFTYDDRGRLLNQTFQLNNSSPVTIAYSYDALGQPTSKILRQGSGISYQETYAYNVRGWLTFKQNFHFNQQLRYQTTSVPESTPYFNGNISEWEWHHINGTTEEVHLYSFSYDQLGRLGESRYYDKQGNTWNQSNHFAEDSIHYDRNGNILQLRRTRGAGDTAQNLNYTYNGNLLTSLSGGYTGNYSYDANGNMTHDGRKNLNISWNCLNLLSSVSSGGTLKATYRYLADGSKLSVRNAAGTEGFDYIGSLTYKKSSAGLTLEGMDFGDGHILKNANGSYETKFFFKDHLGSVRVIVDAATNTVEERNDYYPFGGQHERGSHYAQNDNRYKYNGKEKQTTENIDYLDYGARMYDAELGRWFAVDPLAENYLSTSPFAYCENNSISFVDLWGMAKGSTNPSQWSDLFEHLANGKSISDFDDSSWETVPDPEPRDPPGVWGDYLRSLPKDAQEEYVNNVLGYSIIDDLFILGWGTDVYGEETSRLWALAGIVPVPKYLKKPLKKGGKYLTKTFKVTTKKIVTTSGWVKRSVFDKLDPSVQKKIASAIEKGIVPPDGTQGIVRLTATEAAETGYQYKIKILGKGGDIRIYGNPLENGHIFFDKIMYH